MRKVLSYSLLLIVGLVVSPFLGAAPAALGTAITLATMFALSFILIHVGYEFEIDKSRPRQYLWDYVVAGTAAAFPWVFCALYFVFVMAPPDLWAHGSLWKEALLEARFASPTSAGVLFSMLAAAGLGATWMFQKARVLAIFDDLDTILLMIPLKIMMVGLQWQLLAIVLVILALLWIAWKYLDGVRLPITWPWVMGYAAAITALSEAIHLLGRRIDPDVPVHLEVLLPAFVLGCIIKTPAGQNPRVDDAIEGTEQGPEGAREQRVSTLVSACFMVLVGLSMPPIGSSAPTALAPVWAAPLSADTPDPGPSTASQVAPNAVLTYEGVRPETLAEKNRFPGWGPIALHVLAITALSNLGKMFPLFCYRREASLRQRLALSVGMFPRGEVGAGVLVLSLSYGLGGPALTVAVLSLALNLLCTGLFILVVKKLLAGVERMASA